MKYISYITLSLSLYIYINQHKLVDFYKFQNYAFKVVRDICNGPQSRCTLSAYIGVFGCGIEACRPWDPSRKRKARRWRDELREREGCERRSVEQCGVANGYCLKRWRMDHGCVGFPGKMDPFFFPAPFPTSCGEIKGMRWMVSAAYFFGISWWKFFLSHVFDICLNCYLSCKYWIKKSNEIFEFLFDFIHLNCIL